MQTVLVRAGACLVTPGHPVHGACRDLLRFHAALAEGFCSSLLQLDVVSNLVCQPLVNC